MNLTVKWVVISAPDGLAPDDLAPPIARNLISLNAWHLRGISKFEYRVKGLLHGVAGAVVTGAARRPGPPGAHRLCTEGALSDGLTRHFGYFKCGVTHKPCERVTNFPDFNWPDRRLYILRWYRSHPILSQSRRRLPLTATRYLTTTAVTAREVAGRLTLATHRSSYT